MTEKLNSNPEQATEGNGGSAWDSLAEVPFAGDRVEDVDKARAMAEAMNENMSVAARAGKMAENAQSDSRKFSAEYTADKQRGFAEIKAERAAQEYDGVANDGLVEDIDKARAMAEAENDNRSLAAEENRAASVIEGNDPAARKALMEDLKSRGFNMNQIGQIFANPDRVRESANKHNAVAEKQGENAGYLYDANK